jgi:hypothetical protein
MSRDTIMIIIRFVLAVALWVFSIAIGILSEREKERFNKGSFKPLAVCLSLIIAICVIH